MIQSAVKTVAIIVPNWNDRLYLQECLPSLEALDFPRDAYQIILVDNGSTDGSAAYVRTHFPAVTVIELPQNLGFVGGANAGLRYALARGFDYVVLLNADVRVETGWLAALVKAAETDERIGAVQSLVLLYKEPDKINTTGDLIHYLGFGYCANYGQTVASVSLLNSRGPIEIPAPSGAAVLLRASALRTVGLLDEQYFLYHDDIDLGWRLRLAGYRIVLAPDSIVYHHYEFTRRAQKFFWLERNRWLTLLKNYRGRTLVLLSPALLSLELAMLGYASVNGWLGAKLRSYAAVLRRLPSVRRERRRIAQLRKLPDRAVVQHFADTLQVEGLHSPLIRLGNACLRLYWHCARRLILW